MTKRRLNPEELAEALDRRLDEAPTPDDDPLVQVAQRLADEQPPVLSAAVRRRMEQRVLGAAGDQSASARVYRFPRRWVTLASAAAAVLMVLFVVPLVSAAAVPGDVLYPVKRAGERVQLAAAGVFDRQAEIYLQLAQRRADEALTLLDRGTYMESLVDESLRNLEQVAVYSDGRSTDVGRTVEVFASLEYVAGAAAQQGLLPPQTDDIGERLATAQADDRLLLPTQTPTVTQTQTPSPAATQTASVRPTRTATPAPPTATATRRPTETPTIEETETPAPPPTATPDLLQQLDAGFVDAVDRVNVRANPDGDIITVAEPLTTLAIVSRSGDWVQVELPDGTQGWIAARLVSEGAPPPDNPGRGNPPDNAGPPDNPGRGNPPDDAGPPDNPGRGNLPDNAGPPDNLGRGNPPDNAGPPDNPGHAGD